MDALLKQKIVHRPITRDKWTSLSADQRSMAHAIVAPFFYYPNAEKQVNCAEFRLA